MLVEHQRYLQKLKEIQARKGVNTEPHILLEIEDREAEIQRLEAELDALAGVGVATSLPGLIRHPYQWFKQLPLLARWLVFGGVGLALVAGVWVLVEPSSRGGLTKQSNPCFSLPVPVKVVVAQLPHCSAESQTQLVNMGAAGAESEGIALSQSFETGAAARTQEDYDLVIWGTCSPSESNMMALNFELTTTRKPDELYEPATVALTGTLDSQVELGRAIISYQRGDYQTAADQFGRLTVAKTYPEAAMLWGNSLLFAGRYDDAIEAYQNIISIIKPDWPAAYNNLGVAKFNKDLLDVDGFPLSGRDSFERAIELAREQDESNIELLATVNQSDLLRRVGNWNTAAASCETAKGINAQSPYPYLCQVLVDLSAGAGSAQGIPFYKIDQDLDAAEQLDGTLPRLYFLRASWYREQNQSDKAKAAYERFFELMQHRACLQTDIKYVDDARRFYNELN